MNIMLLPDIRQLLPAPATSLVLLMLLALGTFLAGLSLLSGQICFLGISFAIFILPTANLPVRTDRGCGPTKQVCEKWTLTCLQLKFPVIGQEFPVH